MTKTEGASEPDKVALETLAAEATADPTGEAHPGAAQEVSVAAPVAAPPPSAAKRGRGRPVGTGHPKKKPATAAAVQPEPEPIIPPAILRSVIQAPYALAAAQYGDHWKISDEDADGMIPAHQALAEQYLPAVLKKNTALYTVAFLHLMTVFGKTQIHFALQAELEKKRRESAEPLIRPATRPGPKPVPSPTDALSGPDVPVGEIFQPRVKPSAAKEKPPS